jgi:hypothetical protein
VLSGGGLLLAELAAACGSAANPVAVAPSPTAVTVIIEAKDTAAPGRLAATPATVARVGPTATRVPIAPTPIQPAEPAPAPTAAPASVEPAAPTPESTATPSATPKPTPAPIATPRPQSPTAADSFDPAGLTVDADSSGLATNPGIGFISLDDPIMIPAGDAVWLEDDEIVMGLVAHNGETRAFPVRQMAYHHIANLSVAGVPYLVTY